MTKPKSEKSGDGKPRIFKKDSWLAFYKEAIWLF